MHREEGEIEADEHQPEVDLAETLVEVAAVHLREPVVEASEQTEDEAAEQDVMEVGHDVIGIGLLGVGRNDRVRHARQSADGEHRDEPEREQHRGREPHRALVHRREPVEDLHAGRDRDQHRREAERRDRNRAQSGGEHVVRPHTPSEETDRDAGEDDDRVAEQRLAREDRQGLGHDAHAGEDEDVDLGMAEQPEEVLIEEGVAPAVRIEEERPEVAIEVHHDHRNGDDRDRECGEERDHEHHPHEHRHAHERHPGRAQVEDRDDEVDGRGRRADAQHHEADGPEVGSSPG